MKRSIHVAAPLLALAASAMIAGCRKPEMRRCVDEHNVVVADALCAAQENLQQQNHGGGGGVVFLPYRYYYGGYGGFGLGSSVGGGGFTAAPGRSYVNSSGVRSGTARGGFGGSFSEGGAHGGGGSGE
ncbi:hypothetical protein [Granulicella sibirica]|uniref:Uncharacterized protein n=1 Tax=Granulicella sibirica TaxID=2479048 RepID=A0A4V1L621_9BACT|nr:hypothetical protein [Granulicella sibirica]RXH57744.1 hypothetical protein GRAN_1054 [Granulicella sibirica]